MRTALLAMCVAAAAQAGCSSVKCGPGTYQDGDNCVGYDPNDHTPPMTSISPASERSRNAVPDPIVLTPNEAATVYYTTDGTDPDPASTPGHRDMATIRGLASPTTIKYFSVDTAGNREEVQSAKFEQDITGPGPVTGMTVSMTGTTAHVTWTNPTDADYAGTAIARVVDVVDAAPTDGSVPLLNDSLSPSLQIVSLGTGTSFDDPGVRPGLVRYVAWTYDDLGNFSNATAASTTLPIGSLTAELVYDTTTSKLTFNSVPSDIDIMTSTTASVSGTTLTVTLVSKNNANSYLVNPKVEVTSVTGATLATSDGTADTFPYKSLGANAFAPGATVTTTLTFTTSGTTITIDLKFASHGSVITTIGSYGYYFGGGVQLHDLGSTSTAMQQFKLATPGPGGRTYGRTRPAAFIGGHFVDIPTTHGAVERFDLATGMAAGVAPLTDSDQANVQGLLAANGGEIAVLKMAGKGNPRYGAAITAPIKLVRLDEGLHVLQTVSFTFTDSSGRAQPELSPDGTTIAIAANDAIALIDAKTLAQIDSDPGTTDLDLFTPASQGRIGTILWLNNTDLFVLTRKTGQAAIIHRAGNTYTSTLVFDDKTTYQGGFGAAIAPDGKVWMSFPTTATDTVGLQIYDPVAGTTTQLAGYTPVGAGTSGVIRIGSDMWVIRGDHMGLDRVDNTGAKLQSIVIPSASPYGYVCSPGCNGIYGHWLQVAQ